MSRLRELRHAAVDFATSLYHKAEDTFGERGRFARKVAERIMDGSASKIIVIPTIKQAIDHVANSAVAHTPVFNRDPAAQVGFILRHVRADEETITVEQRRGRRKPVERFVALETVPIGVNEQGQARAKTAMARALLNIETYERMEVVRLMHRLEAMGISPNNIVVEIQSIIPIELVQRFYQNGTEHYVQ